MNILFVLYGDLSCNSAHPLALYAYQLHQSGHKCAVALPKNLETYQLFPNAYFRAILFNNVLNDIESVFNDGHPADIIHAWSPRENVRKFVSSYMAKRPTPLIVYLEDNESWIACNALGLDNELLFQHTEEDISNLLPDVLSHPFKYNSFVGLADAVVLIQDKLEIEVPWWVYCKTVMPPIDLEFFSPRKANPSLRKKFAISDNESVIIYPGGLNQFTRPLIEALCRAVCIINQQGFPCKLLRTGPVALDFFEKLPPEASSFILDLGILPREELPNLMALANVFVQPGKIDAFEDLRLPGKLPELFAMACPVVMPDVNISHLLNDGIDAVLTKTGSAEEIASKCIDLLNNPEQAIQIGLSGRKFAENNFDAYLQTKKLEEVYQIASDNFSHEISSQIWQNFEKHKNITILLANKLELLTDLTKKRIVIDIDQMLEKNSQFIIFNQKRICGLEARVNVNENEINNLLNTLREKDAEIYQIEQELISIQKSIFWPYLKIFIIKFKRIELIKKALPYALSKCGGFKGLVLHAFNAYKTEGIYGIKRRILFSASTGEPTDFTKADRIDYKKWIRLYDTFTVHNRKKIQDQIKKLVDPPLISILMPVYNPPLKFLEAAICSIKDQLYSNWELCVADDASTDPAVCHLLKSHAESDPRIKLVFREKNGHISAASNSALELVNGDFFALFDHDDLLPEHALFWIAEAIKNNPNAKIIYTDEDKIDLSGRRFAPYFKPDWNPDLFLSQNYICHLGVYNTELVRRLGGFREGYEGAQDYDLALRCSEEISINQIVHIPRVLYHWRSHPGSTALAGSEKNYALIAGQRALNDKFERLNISANVELNSFGMYRVKYSIPATAPLVSLIIPTRNGLKLIKQCIESIFNKTTYQNYEIIIVDNNSDDKDTLAYLAQLKESQKIRILRDDRPFNFSLLNNNAVKEANGEYIGLINNDIEVITPEWLNEMMGLVIQPGVGVVGARLWYPDYSLQHGGVILGLGGVAGHSHKHLRKGVPGYFYRDQLIQTMSAVTAACLVVKKQIYEQVGGLDEINLKVAFNDIDFCLKVRDMGYRNIWTPYAELFHHESASRGIEDTIEKQKRFKNEIVYMQTRWGHVLMNDPAYSPNLTLDEEDFSYAWPPRVKFI